MYPPPLPPPYYCNSYPSTPVDLTSHHFQFCYLRDRLYERSEVVQFSFGGPDDIIYILFTRVLKCEPALGKDRMSSPGLSDASITGSCVDAHFKRLSTATV